MRNENSRSEHNFKAPRTGHTGEYINIEKEDLEDDVPDVRSQIDKLSKEFLNYKTKPIDFDDPIDFQAKKDEELRRKQLSDQMRNLEMQNLSKLYAETIYSTTTPLTQHLLQQNRLSCTLASAANILKFFNKNSTISESAIASAIGEDGAAKTINVEKTLEFLKSQGFNVERVKSVLDMVERLIDGQVIMYTIPQSIDHRVVISAVKIKKGEIDFLFNDPLKEEPYWVSYRNMVDKFSYDPQVKYAEAIIKK